MRIAVTGATGYVGSRIIPVLVEAGHEVIAGVRDPDRVRDFDWGARVQTRHFDLDDPESFRTLTRDVDAVLYLVHSMAAGDFVRKDREAAQRMADALAENAVARVIYVSGHVPDVPDAELSDHVRSRAEVERVLLDGAVPATVLRAAVIIGSGSTSFELIRRLTERLPARVLPTWMNHDVQPIALTDLVTVIERLLEREPTNEHVDLGGPEVLSYPELLARYADVARLVRRELLVPLLPAPLVGQLAARVSGIPRGTVVALVDSLHHDMICHDSEILERLGVSPIGIDEAIERALTPVVTGTTPDGDPLAPAATDPGWAGGGIIVASGTAYRTEQSRFGRMLLGPGAEGGGCGRGAGTAVVAVAVAAAVAAGIAVLLRVRRR